MLVTQTSPAMFHLSSYDKFELSDLLTFRLFFVPEGGGGTIHMTGQCTEDVVVCGGDYFSPVSDRGCCVVILTVVSICLFSHITGQVWPYIVYRRTWLKRMHVNIVYCAGTRSLAVHRKPVK